MAYTLTQKQFSSMKSSLTRALNSGDPKRVLKVCDLAFDIFEAQGYPDAWHRWERAREDARLDIAAGTTFHVGGMRVTEV